MSQSRRRGLAVLTTSLVPDAQISFAQFGGEAKSCSQRCSSSRFCRSAPPARPTPPPTSLAALGAVAAPSAEEMRTRLLDSARVVYEEEHRRRAVATLPSSIRDRRITDGKLLRRVERVARPVLELHRRAEFVELFLYRDHLLNLLRAELRGGCVLLLSDSLAAALDDEELAGIIAHEMGHAYFMRETLAARAAGDDEWLRVIELKCDAVAMLTLKLLGRDPSGHLRGLWKITNLKNDLYIWNSGYETLLRNSASRTHPNIVDRGVFNKRFVNLLTR